MKLCNVCSVEKEESEFYLADRTRGYLQTWCKECAKKKASARFKSRQKDDNLYRLKTHYKAKFGLDEKDTERLLEQATHCSICKREFDGQFDKQLDHCHKTGKIRDFLCHRCNKALGLFRDDVETLKSALSYIERYL